MRYSLINLGNTGNAEDGYEFDSAHYTGKVVEFAAKPSLQEVIDALRGLGALTEKATDETVYVHEWELCCDSESITLRERTTGMWLFELRPL